MTAPKRKKVTVFDPDMGIKELNETIIRIVSKETALQFKIDYIAFTKDFWKDRFDPYQTVNDAIASCFGKMTPEQIQMWNTLGVNTPKRRIQQMRY